MSTENNINVEATMTAASLPIEAQKTTTSFTFKEELSSGLMMELNLNNIHVSTSSQFQKIDVIETSFGKTLVTDGKIQSTQFDEFVYHESLVHPALLKFANSNNGEPAKRVFIGGGGTLATAREVLRHHSIEHVLMVDLDSKVVAVSQEHLPEWGGETVLDDPRMELTVGNVHGYLLHTDEYFDVVIMDVSDPIEAGPDILLYTREFYEQAMTKLNPNGVFVTQGGKAGIVTVESMDASSADDSCFALVNNTLKSVFDCVIPYTTNIPSYGCDWGFIIAFKHDESSLSNEELELQWKKLDRSTIDDLIGKHIKDEIGGLRYYDGETHQSMFALAKPLRNYLNSEKRVMTSDNKAFVYPDNAY